MQEKNCSKCGFLKSLEDFYNQLSSVDGKKSECKTCSKLRKTEFKSKYPDRYKEQDKRAKENRKESIQREHKDYYQKHKETIQTRHREWRKKNSAKLTEYYSAPKFKIARNLRNRVRKAMFGTSKSAKTLDLLGCSIEQYLAYLESKFLPLMTWENYGEWHIDHIIPCNSFDLTDSEQQKVCFHWSNTQPLWAKDNQSKSDRSLL